MNYEEKDKLFNMFLEGQDLFRYTSVEFYEKGCDYKNFMNEVLKGSYDIVVDGKEIWDFVFDFDKLSPKRSRSRFFNSLKKECKEYEVDFERFIEVLTDKMEEHIEKVRQEIFDNFVDMVEHWSAVETMLHVYDTKDGLPYIGLDYDRLTEKILRKAVKKEYS
jgi:hypothetical protein